MRIELAEYRLNKAKEVLKESEDSLKQKHFALSVNRSYYAMFTSARALLVLKELDSSKHSGVIALFNQYIIKAGFFPKEFSRFLPKAKDIREDADYGDFVEITEEDAQIQLKNARKFTEEAGKTMQRMIKKAENR
ncbi:MAG: HEPN domain-containing protein [Candidatus Aerophobetes bacterium]|nr:HEPN domain-containing protein [Candidatus Aerophobetes bacterium]